jgi:hypothetical protein
MSDVSHSDSAADMPVKRGVSPLRIVLFAVLLVAAGALVYDYMGRLNRDAAMKKVAARMPQDEAPPEAESLLDGTPTQKEVLEILGRTPDGEPARDGDTLVATYSWPGVFYTHKLEVHYSGTLEPRAVRVTPSSTSNFAKQ